MIFLSASVLPRLPEGVGATQSRAGSTKSAIDGEQSEGIDSVRSRAQYCTVIT
jgi:hypothetical protein